MSMSVLETHQTFTVELRFALPPSLPLGNSTSVPPKHVIQRRFRQFSALGNMLKARYPGVPPVPAKRLFSTRTADFLEKRRQELDIFLQAIIRAPYSGDSIDLGAFLGLGATLNAAYGKFKTKLLQPSEPVSAALARGLGEIVYLTQSFCPACAVTDTRGRGRAWKPALVARCDSVSFPVRVQFLSTSGCRLPSCSVVVENLVDCELQPPRPVRDVVLQQRGLF
jgi:PX domain